MGVGRSAKKNGGHKAAKFREETSKKANNVLFAAMHYMSVPVPVSSFLCIATYVFHEYVLCCRLNRAVTSSADRASQAEQEILAGDLHTVCRLEGGVGQVAADREKSEGPADAVVDRQIGDRAGPG